MKQHATRAALGLAAVALILAACLTGGERADGAEPRWLKGNTHAHTLWSDGDGAPELVVDWYREHGYDFLVLSDHNLLQEGQRWMPVREGTRLTWAHIEQLQQRFGPGGIDVSLEQGGFELRLATLDELRAQFERPGEFVLLTGEEITDQFEGKPLHVNGVHLVEPIAPRGGTTLRETLNADVEAVLEQARRLGRPMLAHVNHPNFGWALTWEDLAHVRGDRFFEVYNGHHAVRNEGDAEHPSTEHLWDLANTLRLTELDLPLLFGLATDDGHNYHEQGLERSNPGRGWVVVRAAALDGDSIVRAMRRGDFYASSGVVLREVRTGGGRYVVVLEPRPGEACTTAFVGTRLVDGRPAAIGATLAETTDNPAIYEFRGDELFVRAVVTSTRPHPNPYRAGDLEQAWTQPVSSRGAGRLAASGGSAR